MRAQRSSSVAATSGKSLFSSNNAPEMSSAFACVAIEVREAAPAMPMDFLKKDLRDDMVSRFLQ